MTSQPIIDAHHHFWDLSLCKHPWLDGRKPIHSFRYGNYSSIMKDYLLPDYRRDWGKHRIVKSVYVETEWDPTDPTGEAKWVQRYHDETGFPHAMVAQVWFERDDIEAVLKAYSHCQLIRSVRQKPTTIVPGKLCQSIPRGSMSNPKFREGYKNLAKYGLHYDLQVPWWHLREASELARTFPETIIILNHTGLPADRSPGALKNWLEAIQEFAVEPNTAVKISGIGVPGVRWNDNENAWIIHKTICTFGIDRCMFASNFPVDGLCDTFTVIYEKFKSVVCNLPYDHQVALFHDNAVKYYQPL
ncbi:MAG: thioesterase [Rhodospirillaceae bacterium]|nr:thioesterase [Rhodospirillaceae bacterium]